MKKKKGFGMSTTRIIMLGFLMTILIGSVLLALPISSAQGVAIPYLDALFMATTATCVTGLVTLPVYTTWSVFGQVVILILIQIGGLGVITILSGVVIAANKKLGLKDRVLIQDAFNLNSLSGLIKFTKKVIKGTLFIEFMGAIAYLFVFVPEYGLKGIWISVFTSISAFCNAGIDIISADSLSAYMLNPVVNIVTCILIFLGGIGYIVWWDMLRVMKNTKKKRYKMFKNLTLHSKIVLWMSFLLITVGGILIFAFEFNNPATIGNLNFWEKIEVSMFQSVTTRTAGFSTIPQQDLSNASAFTCLLLMFIGGSPVGTAGGVKTVTFAVVIAAMIATVRNKDEVVLFNRNISKQSINKASAVICMSFAIVFTATVLLAAVTDAPAVDVIYETVSAGATVGLTRNLTGTLNVWGKMIIICTMYLGRVGPISLAVAFNTQKTSPNLIKNPTEEISVG